MVLYFDKIRICAKTIPDSGHITVTFSPLTKFFNTRSQHIFHSKWNKVSCKLANINQTSFLKYEWNSRIRLIDFPADVCSFDMRTKRQTVLVFILYCMHRSAKLIVHSRNTRLICCTVVSKIQINNIYFQN